MKKPKKKLYKKWRFWVLVVFMLFCFGKCSSAPKDEDASSVTAETVSATESKTTKEKTTQATTIIESTTDLNSFVKTCEKMDYKSVTRNPDSYKGKPMYIKGKVVQVSESSIFFSDDKNLSLRVDTTEGEYGIWEDTVYVTFVLKAGESRILEEDIVTIYGVCQGVESYTTILGSTVTIPSIEAKSIELTN